MSLGYSSPCPGGYVYDPQDNARRIRAEQDARHAEQQAAALAKYWATTTDGWCPYLSKRLTGQWRVCTDSSWLPDGRQEKYGKRNTAEWSAVVFEQSFAAAEQAAAEKAAAELLAAAEAAGRAAVSRAYQKPAGVSSLAAAFRRLEL